MITEDQIIEIATSMLGVQEVDWFFTAEDQDKKRVSIQCDKCKVVHFVSFDLRENLFGDHLKSRRIITERIRTLC